MGDCGRAWWVARAGRAQPWRAGLAAIILGAPTLAPVGWRAGLTVDDTSAPGEGSPFEPHHFQREDERDDRLFYVQPRLVVHIDEGALAAVGRAFEGCLPQDGELLDLMSSWRSHLPPGFRKRRLVGLGLNAVELQENPQLDDRVVHDLNRDPRLPFPDAVFDGAMLTVSVQYLVQPLAVFQEVRRVLRPGGPFLVTFSNRMFPTKAVQVWRMFKDAERAMLVQAYFRLAGGWSDIRAEDRSPPQGDPLYLVWARKGAEQRGTL
ncbi:MAG: methyltransferase domain-containing protein [Chloroflexi bacterium]|nr:methyltransferase domain-containing protein [Chloroflexota bacterium]